MSMKEAGKQRGNTERNTELHPNPRLLSFHTSWRLADLYCSGASTPHATLVINKRGTPLASTSALLTTCRGSTILAGVLAPCELVCGAVLLEQCAKHDRGLLANMEKDSKGRIGDGGG